MLQTVQRQRGGWWGRVWPKKAAGGGGGVGEVGAAKNIGLLGAGFRFILSSVERSAGARTRQHHDGVLGQRGPSREAGDFVLLRPDRLVSESLWVSNFL